MEGRREKERRKEGRRCAVFALPCCCFPPHPQFSLRLPNSTATTGGRKKKDQTSTPKSVNSKKESQIIIRKRKKQRRRRSGVAVKSLSPLSPQKTETKTKRNSPVVESCPASTTIAVALPVANADSTASLARNSAGGPRPSNTRSTTSSRSRSGCAVGSASMKGCSVASRRRRSFNAWSQRASTASQSA